MKGAAQMSTVGLTLVLCSAIGFGIGYWIDGKWRTSPWGGVIGFLFGTAAGFLEMFQLLQKANRDD
jgi:F0F1-type ATP synthase assembly protein I